MEVIKKLMRFSKAENQDPQSSVLFLIEELRETDKAIAVYEHNIVVNNATSFEDIICIEEIIDGHLDCMFVCLSGMCKYGTTYESLTETYENKVGDGINYTDGLDKAFETVLLEKIPGYIFNICLKYIADSLHMFIYNNLTPASGKYNSYQFILLAFERVCNANLAKLNPLTGRFDKDANRKIIKPNNWQPPTYEDLINEYVGG